MFAVGALIVLAQVFGSPRPGEVSIPPPSDPELWEEAGKAPEEPKSAEAPEPTFELDPNDRVRLDHYTPARTVMVRLGGSAGVDLLSFGGTKATRLPSAGRLGLWYGAADRLRVGLDLFYDLSASTDGLGDPALSVSWRALAASDWSLDVSLSGSYAIRRGGEGSTGSLSATLVKRSSRLEWRLNGDLSLVGSRSVSGGPVGGVMVGPGFRDGIWTGSIGGGLRYHFSRDVFGDLGVSLSPPASWIYVYSEPPGTIEVVDWGLAHSEFAQVGVLSGGVMLIGYVTAGRNTWQRVLMLPNENRFRFDTELRIRLGVTAVVEF